MLTLLGLNIKKLFRFYDGKLVDRFWSAPNDIKPQQFSKPSAKRLSKKGTKTNNRIKEGIRKNKLKEDVSPN